MNWKDIKDFKGIYKVNSLGEVRRAGATQNRKKQLTRKGYYKVFLYNKNNKRAYFVHRLVAQTFIPNPQNKPNINHKNCLKTDNRVNNLEWCTTIENNQHAKKMGLYKPLEGSKHGMSALTEKIVLDARQKAKEGMSYVSIANFYGVDPATIRRAVIKESWRHI